MDGIVGHHAPGRKVKVCAQPVAVEGVGVQNYVGDIGEHHRRSGRVGELAPLDLEMEGSVADRDPRRFVRDVERKGGDVERPLRRAVGQAVRAGPVARGSLGGEVRIAVDDYRSRRLQGDAGGGHGHGHGHEQC